MFKEKIRNIKFIINTYKRIKYIFGFGPEYNQWVRVVMNRETVKLVKELPYSDLKCLEISGDVWKDFPFKSYKSIHYPEFDICQEVLAEKYDIIISEQVFEHLLYPYRAAKKCLFNAGKKRIFFNYHTFFSENP